MKDLFVNRENKYNFRNFQALESSHQRTGSYVWNIKYNPTGDLKYGTLPEKV